MKPAKRGVAPASMRECMISEGHDANQVKKTTLAHVMGEDSEEPLGDPFPTTNASSSPTLMHLSHQENVEKRGPI